MAPRENAVMSNGELEKERHLTRWDRGVDETATQ